MRHSLTVVLQLAASFIDHVFYLKGVRMVCVIIIGIWYNKSLYIANLMPFSLQLNMTIRIATKPMAVSCIKGQDRAIKSWKSVSSHVATAAQVWSRKELTRDSNFTSGIDFGNNTLLKRRKCLPLGSLFRVSINSIWNSGDLCLVDNQARIRRLTWRKRRKVSVCPCLRWGTVSLPPQSVRGCVCLGRVTWGALWACVCCRQGTGWCSAAEAQRLQSPAPRSTGTTTFILDLV